MRIFSYVFVLAITLVTTSVSAQRWHLGIMAGASNYKGDLTPRFYVPELTHGAVFGSLGFELSDHIMLRGKLGLSSIAGYDKFNKDQALVARNLSFNSKVYEASFNVEYSLLSIYERRYTPFLSVGLAAMHANPYTIRSNGRRVNLLGTRTEGQGTPANPEKVIDANRLILPLGAGFRYALNDHFQVAAEFGLRILFTDYIDDVSGVYANRDQLLASGGPLRVELAYRGGELPGGDPTYPREGTPRGTSSGNDVIYYTGIHLTYRLGKSGRSYGVLESRKSGKSWKCPTNVY